MARLPAPRRDRCWLDRAIVSWLVLVLFSGSLVSTDRYAYGIVSRAIVAGIYLAKTPYIGRPVIIYLAVLLASFAVRFARSILGCLTPLA